MTMRDQATWRSYLRDCAIAVAAAVLVNALVFSTGIDRNGVSAQAGPPGWFVGLVWIVLFALFGIAHAELKRDPSVTARRLRRSVVLLGLFCLAFPAYTIGFASATLGFIGCLLTGAWVAALILGTRHSARRVSLLLLPCLLWLCYASWLSWQDMMLPAPSAQVSVLMHPY